MKFFRRAALVVVLVLLLLAVGLYIAARFYLTSEAVTRQVSARLQAMLGAPVDVGSADVGLTGASTLHGLRIFEPGDENKKAPFVVVDGATADVSALDLLRGMSPGQVTLRGASVALHFDADGNLLTRLPRPKTTGGPMPRLHIDKGRLTLNQDGRKPMIVQGVQGDLTPDGADLKAAGSVADPFWGAWSLSGSLAGESGTVDLTLDAKGVAVDKARLTGLPFVAPAVWDEVMVEGKTPCNFNLRLQLQDHPTIHYRVQCAPDDAVVRVKSIEMNADHAAGKVVVDDNLVQLRGVHGKFAGGDIATDADLDFRKPAWVLTFSTVSVDKIVWHELPQLWVDALLPAFLKDYKPDGVFKGRATDLRVSLEDGKVQVAGSGQGEIDDVTLNGKPQPEPIKVTLGTHDGKFGNVTLNPRPGLLATALAATVAVAPPAAAADAPPAPASPRPADLLRWTTETTAWLTNRGAAALGKGMNVVGAWLRSAGAPEPKPEYLALDLSLEDIDLAQLLQRLKFQLSFTVEGRLTFKVHAEFPVNTPEDLKNYRLTGTASLPRLNVAGVEMTDVQARLHLENGILEMQELKGKAPAPKGGADAAGAFEGTARMEVAPLGDLSGNLRVDQFPLDVLLSRLPGASGLAEGGFSGHVEMRAAVKTLTDPTTWHAKGQLTSDRIAAYGLALTGVSADVAVEGGAAKVSGLKATLDKATLSGDAGLTLAAPWTYTGALSVKGLDLAAAQRLAPAFRPPFDVGGAADATADLRGTLRPLSVSASGTASGSDLALDQFKVDSLSLKWLIDGDRVKLTDVKAKLYQGEVSGSADVPTRAAAAGAVDFQLDDVDVQALAKGLPLLPLRLQGRASGSIRATIPAAGPDGQRQATGKIDLSAKALTVQNIPTDNLHADVDYKAGVAEYHLKGDSLGGHFTLDGKVPFTAAEKPATPGGGDGASPDKDQPQTGGRFRFEGIQLSRLSKALGLGSALGQLHGRADVDLPFQVGPDNAFTGAGKLAIRNLRIDGALLTDSLTANVVLKNQTVQVRNLNASVGQGNFRGVVVYNLREPDRSFFRLILEQVDASALLASYPDAAAQVQGPADLRLRGNLGRRWHGSGGVDLTRGRVFGAVVDELHLPVTFEFSPARQSGRVTIRDANAQLAGGRATGQAEFDWSGGEAPRLEGEARFNNAEVRSLVKPGGSLGSYLVGRVTGRVNFGSDGLRSLDDLEATVSATLADSQALEIPVLSSLAPYLVPGQSATTFEKGDLRGRLSRGVFRLQRLTLSSSIVRMAVVGTVNTAGRLDLDVTGGTGTLGVNPTFLQAIGLRIPAVGPIPVSLLLEASALLSNRVIHLRITGTVRNPNVQTEPVRILAEEAVRFFVLQSGAPVP